MSQLSRAFPSLSIDYPDSDGEPMAENTLQHKWIAVIQNGLETLFAANPDVFVAGDLFWYAVEGNNEIRTAPDVMVVFGRPKGHRGSYMQWREGGIPPQVVFEVLSPGNRRFEMEQKRRLYFRYGVKEYYIYDPDSGSLKGWTRGRKEFRAIPDMDGYQSPRLGVRFHPGPGKDNLVIVGPDGERFLTFQELHDERKAEAGRTRVAVDWARTSERLAKKERARADAEQAKAAEEKARADAERTKAAEEKARADAEQARAERLAARLRELGVDPE